MRQHINRRPFTSTNDGKENYERNTKSNRKGSKLACETFKKYSDMRKSHVKVTYNVMGEPVKTNISFVDRKVSRKSPKQRNQYQYGDPTGYSQSQPEANPLIVKRKQTTYSFLDLERTNHVLREVLLGKISRDMMYPRSTNDSSLPEMLRFFCRASFGATSIAESRQTDLFNAILALQSTSPFIRTMKRLLDIPGIKPFPEQISDVYFEMWTWLLKNDVFAHGESEIDRQNVISTDTDTKLKRLLISEQAFAKCLDNSDSRNRNLFSTNFIKELKQKATNLSRHQPILDLKQDNTHLFDVDEMLEISLQMMEQAHIRIVDISEQLFGESVPRSKILSPKCNRILPSLNHDPSSQIKTEKSFDSLLQEINFILDHCIMFDKNRQGHIQYIHFKEIVRDWCNKATYPIELKHSQFKALFELFQVDNDTIAAANYIDFIGVLYTFLLDEHFIPNINDVITYFGEPRRGVESEHYELLEEYVRISQLKKIVVTVDSIQGHDLHDTATRSNMSTIGCFSSNSDFISKWLTTGSMRNEYRQDLRESLNEARINNTSSRPLTSSHGNRPKTPLYLVEPQGSFEDNIWEQPDTLQCNSEEEGDDKIISQASNLSNLGIADIFLTFPDTFCTTQNHQLNHGEMFSSAGEKLTANEERVHFSGSSHEDSVVSDQLSSKSFGNYYQQRTSLSKEEKEYEPRSRKQCLSPPLQKQQRSLVSFSSPSRSLGQGQLYDGTMRDQICPVESKMIIKEEGNILLQTQHEQGGLKHDNLSIKAVYDSSSHDLFAMESTCEDHQQNSVTSSPLLSTLEITSFPSTKRPMSNETPNIDIPDIQSLPNDSEEPSLKPCDTSPVERPFGTELVSMIDSKDDPISQNCLNNDSSYYTSSSDLNLELVTLSSECDVAERHSEDFTMKQVHLGNQSDLFPVEVPTINIRLSFPEQDQNYAMKANNIDRFNEMASRYGIQAGTLINHDNLLHHNGRNIQVSTALTAAMSSSLRLTELDNLVSRHGSIPFTSFVKRDEIRIPSSVFSMGYITKQILALKHSILKSDNQLLPVETLNITWVKSQHNSQKNIQIDDSVNDQNIYPIDFRKSPNTESKASFLITSTNEDKSDSIIFSTLAQLLTTSKNGFRYKNIHNTSMLCETTCEIQHPVQHSKVQYKYTKKNESMELTNLWLTDKWEWEILFENNESVLLSIISKFQAIHEDLCLSRNRHKPNKIEMENYATCLSLFNRVDRYIQLKTKSKREGDVDKKKKKQSSIYGDFGFTDTFGIGIKSLLQTAHTRKKVNTRNQDSSTSKICKQKIHTVLYRITK